MSSSSDEEEERMVSQGSQQSGSSSVAPEEESSSQQADSEDEDPISSLPVPRPGLARSAGAAGGRERGQFADGDKNDTEVFSNAVSDIVNDLLKSAKVMLPDVSDNGEREGLLKRYSDSLFKLVKVQVQQEMLPEVVNRVFVETGLNAPPESNGELLNALNQFEEGAERRAKEKIKEVKYAQVCKNKSYQKALQELNKLNAPKPTPKPSTSRAAASNNGPPQESQDIVEAGDYIPTQDPITRKPLKNIRVNSQCGHVYEWESIMGMIIASRRTKAIKCPYPGCANKNVTQRDLQEDPEMALKIAQRINEERIE